MDTISAALRRLDMSDSEQVVYLSLLRFGRATARILADRTGLTRPSVYDQLKKLLTQNLIVELDVEGKAYFAASDTKHLDALLADKIDRLEQSRQFLAEAMVTLESGLDTVVPKIRFFEGEDGLKQLMKDVMWHDKVTLVATWNDTEMNKIFDAAFLRWWNERRITRGIKILWQVAARGNQKKGGSTSAKDVQEPKFYTSALDTISPLIATDEPKMTRLMYASKVAYISSQAEAFGFIVESGEFAQLQRYTCI